MKGLKMNGGRLSSEELFNCMDVVAWSLRRNGRHGREERRHVFSTGYKRDQVGDFFLALWVEEKKFKSSMDMSERYTDPTEMDT